MTVPSYVPTNAYADIAFGNAYFADRLRTDAWDSSTDVDKLKALKQATDAIDRLNFAGDKADSTQVNQFPRGNDTEVPQAIARATCELALSFLDEVDPDMEIEDIAFSQQWIGDFRTQRDTSVPQDHVLAGIPSIRAWTLLQPFLRSPKILDVDRS